MKNGRISGRFFVSVVCYLLSGGYFPQPQSHVPSALCA